MKLFNTLSREIEEVVPIQGNKIGLYSCGPTVYDNAHLGHMRKYVGDDLLVRALRYFGFQVNHVMNITDVGHLVSDADEGEDKMEKGARKHGLNVWDVAGKFTQQFFDSTDQLNIARPDIVCKATDHIAEQIQLIKVLEEKGFAYAIEDGVYFDTTQLPDYGALSNLDQVQAGARVEFNQSKRNASDFALWKFSPVGEQRQMEWDSPWGRGFPGWHIECSAMSMKYLGEQFEIHTGGIDHIETHHPNEIAQSEAATGKKPFVKYWLHYNFLMVNGQKMSKSLGNLYTIDDITIKGIEPLALRYLYLQTHYRKELNFTFESLSAADTALKRLRASISKLQISNNKQTSHLESQKAKEYQMQFSSALSDDLNTAQALAVVWEVVKDEALSDEEKPALVMDFDQVLGLRLDDRLRMTDGRQELPEEIKELIEKREHFRNDKQFAEADAVRQKIEAKGYIVEDKSSGVEVRKV